MFSTLLAQTAAPEQGFDIFSLLLPLALGALIFMMFRRQRKTQKTIKEQRTQMVPGTEVMTNFGLFGTVLSLDEENNKAVLELGPGATATVHMQTLTKVVQPEPVEDDEEPPAVPDDASSLISPEKPGQDGVLPGAETEPADTRSDEDSRLDYDNKRDNKDN
ncbi:preprotein translocase subunit YajC [Arthrobacter sp. H20]|uniref:preprotein translocase subunit YajC n=1 Tax=Arthrobacter sp. H20 TaxID=1267981 RepID=UPI0004B6EDC7|nr:preprotein translocase subunit YajC [Arthrobacter sp. H20]